MDKTTECSKYATLGLRQIFPHTSRELRTTQAVQYHQLGRNAERPRKPNLTIKSVIIRNVQFVLHLHYCILIV